MTRIVTLQADLGMAAISRASTVLRAVSTDASTTSLTYSCTCSQQRSQYILLHEKGLHAVLYVGHVQRLRTLVCTQAWSAPGSMHAMFGKAVPAAVRASAQPYTSRTQECDMAVLACQHRLPLVSIRCATPRCDSYVLQTSSAVKLNDLMTCQHVISLKMISSKICYSPPKWPVLKRVGRFELMALWECFPHTLPRVQPHNTFQCR